MEVVRTKAFEKAFIKLPQHIQRSCGELLLLLSLNRTDPRLHTKQVKEVSGVYSFRVTRGYRGLFYINNASQIVVFTIEHRKDVYRHL